MSQGILSRFLAHTFARRKNYFINPRFQLRFLGYTLGIAAATLFIFYAAKLMFFHQVRSQLMTAGVPTDHMVFNFLSRQAHIMDWIFAIAAIIEIVILGVAGVLISHSIAGPFFRLTRHMIGISQSEPITQVRFRKNDSFQEVAEAFNRMTSKIEKVN